LRPTSWGNSPITAEICIHCHVWLKSPYANVQQGPA
jgi:hypothetical protein